MENSNLPKTIVTKRCKLVPLKMTEAEALHSLWTLPEVRKFLWDDEIIAFSTTEEIILTSIAHLAKREFGLWGVYLHQASDLIGFGGFWPFHEPPRIELLYGLAPQHWKCGYATEIAKALIDFSRDQLSTESILASTDAANKASIAVLKRLGMKQTVFPKKTGTYFFKLPDLSSSRHHLKSGG